MKVLGVCIDDAVDAYEHNADRQELELKRLLAKHGLDINKPMKSEFEFDSRSWLLREDPNGEFITLQKLRLRL